MGPNFNQSMAKTLVQRNTHTHTHTHTHTVVKHFVLISGAVTATLMSTQRNLNTRRNKYLSSSFSWIYSLALWMLAKMFYNPVLTFKHTMDFSQLLVKYGQPRTFKTWYCAIEYCIHCVCAPLSICLISFSFFSIRYFTFVYNMLYYWKVACLWIIITWVYLFAQKSSQC